MQGTFATYVTDVRWYIDGTLYLFLSNHTNISPLGLVNDKSLDRPGVDFEKSKRVKKSKNLVTSEMQKKSANNR